MNGTSNYHALVEELFEDFNRSAPISINWNEFSESVDILYRRRTGEFPTAKFDADFVKELCVSVGKSYIDEYHDYLNKGEEEAYNFQKAELLTDSLERLFESAKAHSQSIETLIPGISNIYAKRHFYRRTVYMLERDDQKRGDLHESDTYTGAFEKLCDEGVVLLIEHGITKEMDIFKLFQV